MGSTKEITDVHIHLLLDPDVNIAIRQVVASEKIYGRLKTHGDLIEFLAISNPMIRDWMKKNNLKGLLKLDERFKLRGYDVHNGNKINGKD